MVWIEHVHVSYEIEWTSLVDDVLFRGVLAQKSDAELELSLEVFDAGLSGKLFSIIFDEDDVRRIVQLVDRAEYKRRQAPTGLKVTGRAFGRDRRMPITNRYFERNAEE